MSKKLGLDVVRQPRFPVRVPGAEGRQPDLLLKHWEGGGDSYILGRPRLLLPLRFLTWKRFLRVRLRIGPLLGNCLLAGILPDVAVVLRALCLRRWAGCMRMLWKFCPECNGVNLAMLTNDNDIWSSVVCRNNIWSSVACRVSMAIAKAIGRQLTSRLPGWEGLRT